MEIITLSTRPGCRLVASSKNKGVIVLTRKRDQLEVLRVGLIERRRKIARFKGRGRQSHALLQNF